MDRLGGILATFIGFGILMIAFRPMWNQVWDVMNTTTGLSNMESLVWESVPLAIPIAAVIGSVILLVRRRSPRSNADTWED